MPLLNPAFYIRRTIPRIFLGVKGFFGTLQESITPTINSFDIIHIHVHVHYTYYSKTSYSENYPVLQCRPEMIIIISKIKCCWAPHWCRWDAFIIWMVFSQQQTLLIIISASSFNIWLLDFCKYFQSRAFGLNNIPQVDNGQVWYIIMHHFTANDSFRI